MAQTKRPTAKARGRGAAFRYEAEDGATGGSAENTPLAILAGSGSLPVEIAEGVVARGRSVHVVALRGAAAPEIERFPHTWVTIATVGRILSAMRRNGCREMVIVGGIRRPDVWRLRPDLGIFSVAPTFLKLLRGGDDSVLRHVVRFFERRGFVVRGAADVAPWLAMPEGELGSTRVREDLEADIELAGQVIAALGAFDVGQGVVVDRGRIIAIEGAEGTDRMLERVAKLPGRGAAARSGVLIKLPKPGQELRVDLPVVGPRTIEGAGAAGLEGLAIAAGRSLIAERAEVVRKANELKVFVEGRTFAGLEEVRRARRSRVGESDAELGARVLSTVGHFVKSEGVVVVRGYVLGIETGEGVNGLLTRVSGLRQWGDQRSRVRRGTLVVPAWPKDEAGAEELIACAAEARLAAIAVSEASQVRPAERALARGIASGLRMIQVAGPPRRAPDHKRPLKLFLIAGEHSGDVLGASLMAALKRKSDVPIDFIGVGGEDMIGEGLRPIYPMSDVVVMGIGSIIRHIPRIVARVNETVEAAIAEEPDAVIIIDAPDFTHQIARRIRGRRPDIAIIDYVSPTVWAWRPGRARKMRVYVDRLLALWPFEPSAHDRLGGPPTTYVGHPILDRIPMIRRLDEKELARRLKLDPARPVLVILPGSRRGEAKRLIGTFLQTVERLKELGFEANVIIPAVPHVRPLIEEAVCESGITAHLVEGSEDKFRAFKLARAALAASGTVTIELAVAGTPMVVGYRVDPLTAQARWLITAHSSVLPNLILGRNTFPEFHQWDCTPETLASALSAIMREGPERSAQLEALSEVPRRLALAQGSPGEAAALAVLHELYRT